MNIEELKTLIVQCKNLRMEETVKRTNCSQRQIKSQDPLSSELNYIAAARHEASLLVLDNHIRIYEALAKPHLRKKLAEAVEAKK